MKNFLKLLHREQKAADTKLSPKENDAIPLLPTSSQKATAPKLASQKGSLRRASSRYLKWRQSSRQHKTVEAHPFCQYSLDAWLEDQAVFGTDTIQGCEQFEATSTLPFIAPVAARPMESYNNMREGAGEQHGQQGLGDYPIRTSSTTNAPRALIEHGLPAAEGSSFTTSQMERLDSGLFDKANMADQALRGRYMDEDEFEDTEPIKRDPDSLGSHVARSFTSSMRAGSPVKLEKTETNTPCPPRRTRSPSKLTAIPTRADSQSSHMAARRKAFEFDEGRYLRAPSPTNELIPIARPYPFGGSHTTANLPSGSTSLSQRVAAHLPASIDTDITRRRGNSTVAERGNVVPIGTALTTSSRVSQSSSIYSDEQQQQQQPPYVSPLRITKKRTATTSNVAATQKKTPTYSLFPSVPSSSSVPMRTKTPYPHHVPLSHKAQGKQPEQSNNNILKGYRDWADPHGTPSITSGSTAKAAGPSSSYLEHDITPFPYPRHDEAALALAQVTKHYNHPFHQASFLKDPTPEEDDDVVDKEVGGGSVRKSSKTMIGHHGWLENTSLSKPRTGSSTSPGRKAGFLSHVIKKAKDIMHGDMSSMKPSNRKSHETTGTTTNTSSTSRPRTPRSLAISLTPREQALLYCELEYTISNALNAYLTTEFTAGRLSPSKLKRIADQWQSRGRPKVTGFRYDIETQLDLVRLHVHDFKFYSSPTHSAITSSVVGILDMMTADARALRIRTYCQPDTVIAKQVLDAQNLFNVLGCEDGLQMALAEITGFLRAGIERERHHSAARDRLLSGGGGGVGRDSLRHAKSHSGERGGMGSSSSAGRDLRRVSSFGFAGKGDAGGGFVKEEEDDVF